MAVTIHYGPADSKTSAHRFRSARCGKQYVDSCDLETFKGICFEPTKWRVPCKRCASIMGIKINAGRP